MPVRLQLMLLQDLHDRHVCNSLLVAESEEDIWKNDSLGRQRLNTSDGEWEGPMKTLYSLYETSKKRKQLYTVNIYIQVLPAK